MANPTVITASTVRQFSTGAFGAHRVELAREAVAHRADAKMMASTLIRAISRVMCGDEHTFTPKTEALDALCETGACEEVAPTKGVFGALRTQLEAVIKGESERVVYAVELMAQLIHDQ
ncbi:MAG: hypothetical protein AAGF92_21745 [Myxococcota bacterium]